MKIVFELNGEQYEIPLHLRSVEIENEFEGTPMLSITAITEDFMDVAIWGKLATRVNVR